MNGESFALLPGSFIGDLQVDAVLGEGSSGITYLVTDPAIGTRFALKEYLPAGCAKRAEDGGVKALDGDAGEAFAEGLGLFLAEARLLGALDHPNVARVLRYFEANGTGYFLMPYYPGQTLPGLLESRGPFSREEARDLLLPLMGALAYIHAQGIIHQDIKPANIYVTDAGQPILLDFGVAVRSGAHRPAASGLGSAGYAAPEQSAQGGRVGPWTDIYGLAATLYRCVTGRIPVASARRTEALAAGEADPLQAFAKLAPASRFGGLTDAVEAGLKIEPGERPKDVGAWEKSFKSLDWHRSVVVAAGNTQYAREGKEWLPLTLLAVFLLAMLAIGLFLLTEEVAETGPAGPAASPMAAAPPASADRPAQPPAEEVRRWHAALQADTVLGYRRFLEDFPGSVYAPQARTQLDVLDEKAWLELAAEDSVPAYSDYLDAFPGGLHQAEALARIDAITAEEARRERERLERERLDRLAWEAASAERTIAAFDRYIRDWPAGLHVEEAGRVRRLLKDRAEDEEAFQSALKLDTRAAFQAYIDAFPKGANVASALRHIDDLTLRPGKTFRDCPDCPALVVVPAGAFWQGPEDGSELAPSMEKPRRLVSIGKPLAVSVYEATMAEWDLCVADKACTTRPHDNGWGRGARPVMMVSWNDAEQYAHWLSRKTGQSYRLPSESEWEYFARAGETGEWAGGAPGRVCGYGNIAGAETDFRWRHEQCADGLALGTAPAGSFTANAFGVYDTTGNVAEWTADCMNLSYLDAPVDGSAWSRGICSSHMTRGGSWITGGREIRLPARFDLKNGDRNDFTGFRVVRDIKD